MHEIKSNLPTGMRGFMQWLGLNQPAIHRRFMVSARAQNLSGLGLAAPDTTPAVLDSTQPAAKSTIDTVKDIVTALSQGYLTVEQMNAQKKVLDLQLQRAQQGLPPLNLDMQQYGLTGPQFQVGLTSNTQKMLMYGGAALLAALLLPKLLGKRS